METSINTSNVNIVDIFISYSSLDENVAEMVCQYLESRGYNCFFAKRDIDYGEDYSTELDEAIAQAKIIVLIYSKNSDNSKHVRTEMSLAFGDDKVIMPYRIDNSIPQKLKYFLQLSQWLDASDNNHKEHLPKLFDRAMNISPPKKRLSPEQIVILRVLEKYFKVNEILPFTELGCYINYPFEIDGINNSSLYKAISEIRKELNSYKIIVNRTDRGIDVQVEKPEKSFISPQQIFESEEFLNAKGKLIYSAGIGSENRVVVRDLANDPHLLVVGVVGVEVQEILEFIVEGLMLKQDRTQLKIYLSSIFGGFTKFSKREQLADKIYHSPEDTLKRLEKLYDEMEKRYKLLMESKCMNIVDYNKKHPESPLPYIVFAIEEFCALEVILPKKFETNVALLLQKSRAAGIHLIISTARAESNIIKATLSVNIQTRFLTFVTNERMSDKYIFSPNGTKLSTGYLEFFKYDWSGLERLQVGKIKF